MYPTIKYAKIYYLVHKSKIAVFLLVFKLGDNAFAAINHDNVSTLENLGRSFSPNNAG